MIAKVSFTTVCNAKCKTCPCWTFKGQHMDYADFVQIWTKLMSSPFIEKVIVNNTGDIYNHPDHLRMLKLMETFKPKRVAMITNGGLVDYLPKLDHIVFSFNGGTKESYEHTTGLSFDETVGRIHAQYDRIRSAKILAEIDCLMWEGNRGTELQLRSLWADFPGMVRISYKYDNQGMKSKGIETFVATERIICDYLDKLCVLPDGAISMCAHDWKLEAGTWGNLLTDDIGALSRHPKRLQKMREHLVGRYEGPCQPCDYNTPEKGRIFYVKE